MAESSSDNLLDPATILRLTKKGELKDTVLKLIEQPNFDLRPQEDGSSLLHVFTAVGNFEIVQLLWQRGLCPSIKKGENATLLHSCMQAHDASEDNQRAKILHFLFNYVGKIRPSQQKQGREHDYLPVNHKNSKGWTALKLAARANLEQCVEILLDHGASPDIPDNELYTPLHNAIGNPGIVKLLASRSADIDQRNKDGETALLLACDKGFADSAVILLENKASPDITNKQGITPLFLAARDCNLDLVKSLIRRGANINTPGSSQNIGPLHWAAHKENEGVALFLVQHGANVLQGDKNGATPLSMASPELATKMIAVARSVNPALALPQATPLAMSANNKAMAAACGGNLQALLSLLQSGVSINYSGGSTDASLLHMAVYYGQLHVAVYLLQNGANWRAVDKEGDTLLHYACMKDTKTTQHEKTLEFLLGSSVSMLSNVQNGRGETPIMIALRCGFMSRVRLLLQAKVDVTIGNQKKELPIHRACSSIESIEALFYFAELVSDINIQDSDGWSPLMHAVKASNIPAVKYLLQRGASPSVCEPMGVSPLYLAAQEDHGAIARLLLVGGAEPNVAGGVQKLTPLHVAAHKGSQSLCSILIEGGADIHATDCDGDTPVTLAESMELKQHITMLYLQCQQRREQSAAVDNEMSPSKEEIIAGEGSDSPALVEDSSPTDSPSGAVVLTKQGTFSKESERENGATVPESKYQVVVGENSVLKQTVEQLKSSLSSTQHEHQVLLSRNQTLINEIHRLEAVLLAHHIDAKLSLDGGSKWLICKTDYQITGPQLNTEHSVGKLYDVFPGTYRQLPVVIKMVRGVESWSPEFYQQFYQEVYELSQLHCPWLVQFMGCRIDPEGKECVIITEYMPHGCLHDVLHKSKLALEWRQQVSIVKDVCKAMVFLHSHDTLHRNLVPSNILIGEHLNAKVGDFGLWELQNAITDHTQSQGEAPQVYMAPETIEKLEFTQAADVYSFGIVMCEVSTRQPPYTELDLSSDQTFLLSMKVVMGRRPQFTASVPSDYIGIAERCWQGEPRDRPSFETVLQELNKLTL